MSDMTAGAELSLVLQLERELQTRGCRRDRARLLELLAPDFMEVGTSGRVWDLDGTLKLLDSQANDGDEIEVTELTGRMLADGFILVHWASACQGRRARRTSLWRRDEDGWRQVHHQGTILPD